MEFMFAQVENVMGKGENAGINIFSFFHNVFKKDFSIIGIKSRDCVVKAECIEEYSSKIQYIL